MPKLENLPKFDRRKLHFGFCLGINRPNLILELREGYNTKDSLASVQSKGLAGFHLGIISEFRFHPYFGIRFLPTLSFAERSVEFKFQRKDSLETVVKNVESTYIEFPVVFKYRSARANNFAAYVIGGGKFMFDLSSKKDVADQFSQDVLLKLNNQDFAIELGVGFDFFLEYFKFSPEIKLSFGLKNVLIKDNTIFSNPFDRIRSRLIYINFNFEG